MKEIALLIYNSYLFPAIIFLTVGLVAWFWNTNPGQETARFFGAMFIVLGSLLFLAGLITVWPS